MPRKEESEERGGGGREVEIGRESIKGKGK